MRKVTFRVPTETDIAYVASNMRIADAEEVWASSGVLPYMSLVSSISKSDEAKCALVDGVPAAIFGVCKGQDCGIPWFFGTPAAYSNRKALATMPVKILYNWLDKYGVLFNYVHSRNLVAIAWLSKMGFEILDPVRVGIFQAEFNPFVLRRSCASQ